MSLPSKFDYDEVAGNKIVVNKLEVQSFEMNVYLVKLHVGNQSGMLYSCNSLMRFHSTQQVRDAFETVKVEKAVMIHESAYDEMIGNPAKVQESMAIPFSMTQPY